MKNKKGTTHGVLTWGILGIIGVVILSTVLSTGVSSSFTGTDAISGQGCNTVGCYYYANNHSCQYNSSLPTLCTNTTGTDYALGGLFARTGVVYLVLLAGVLMGVLGYWLSFKR